MARLTDLAKDQPSGEGQGGFQRKAGQPFFRAGGLGGQPEPMPEVAAQAEAQPEPLPAATPHVAESPAEAKPPKPRKPREKAVAQYPSRAERLKKGGLSPHLLASALVRVTPTVQEQPKRELLGEVSRGARLDLTTWAEIEAMAGSQRNMAGWAREALLFVSEQGVAPATLRACSEEIQARREAGGGRGRSLMVALGRTNKVTVEILSERASLSEQAVIEGALELYRKTYQAALAETNTPNPEED